MAIRRAVAAFLALLIALPASFAQAPADQAPGTPGPQPAAAPLSAEQLNNLVAPIALYPDPLLGQVLAASTYPLEIVEAQRWLERNSSLTGDQLMEAARRENWDPSVQALVAFPDTLRLLANDIRWTADLGNAFLAQQADVMSAVQRMRARARANGKLTTTPQQVVTVDNQNGQEEIAIQPADPQVIYVPAYSPAYIWGPPAWGVYPDLWYPSWFSFGWGYGFGPGIYMSFFYPRWIGWGGWGWGCGWHGRGLFLNTGFFGHYGFRSGGFRHYGGRTAWTHDPTHRMGVAYPNRSVASRFGGSRFAGDRVAGSQFAGGTRVSGTRSAASGDWRRFGGNRTGGGQVAAGSQVGGTRSAASGEWRRFSGNRTGAGQVAAGTQAGGVRSGDAGEWRRFSGNRTSGGQVAGGTRVGGARSAAPGEWRRSGDSGVRAGNRSYAGSYRQPAQSYAANGGYRSYQAPAQSYRSSPPVGRSFSPGYSAPRGGGYSAPRSYSAPAQSYSAPRSFSAPRSSGGGSGFSGGRSGGSSGFSGGHSGGGRSGGGGGGHRR